MEHLQLCIEDWKRRIGNGGLGTKDWNGRLETEDWNGGFGTEDWNGGLERKKVAIKVVGLQIREKRKFTIRTFDVYHERKKRFFTFMELARSS